METKLSEVGRNSLPIAGARHPSSPHTVGGKFEGESLVVVPSLEGAGKSADMGFSFPASPRRV